MNYEIVKNIIYDNGNFSKGHRNNMKQILNGIAPVGYDSNELVLKLELALIVDVGKPIYDFIYNWEGDSFLAPFIYHAMRLTSESVNLIVNNHINCPNVVAIARLAAEGDVISEYQYISDTCLKAVPVLQKWNSIFVEPTGKLFSVMEIYKCFELLIPQKLLLLTDNSQAIISMIDTLCNKVPSLKNMADKLKSQLPAYKALTENVVVTNGDDDVDENDDVSTASEPVDDASKKDIEDKAKELLIWWKNNSVELNHWILVVNEAALIQVQRSVFLACIHGCLMTIKTAPYKTTRQQR